MAPPDLPVGDRFQNQYGAVHVQRSGIDWPATECFAVTPNDSLPLLQGPCRGLFVGVAGDITMDDCFDNNVVVKAVPAGTILPFRAKKIYTASTASGMVALY